MESCSGFYVNSSLVSYFWNGILFWNMFWNKYRIQFWFDPFLFWNGIQFSMESSSGMESCSGISMESSSGLMFLKKLKSY